MGYSLLQRSLQSFKNCFHVIAAIAETFFGDPSGQTGSSAPIETNLKTITNRSTKSTKITEECSEGNALITEIVDMVLLIKICAHLLCLGSSGTLSAVSVKKRKNKIKRTKYLTLHLYLHSCLAFAKQILKGIAYV